MDPPKKRLPLPTVLGVKLSDALRKAIATQAQREGLTDSAWLRHVALERLQLDSAPDRVSGRRVPSETLTAAAAAVREIGAAHEPLSRQPPDVGKVKEHLATARQTLADLIRGEARDA